MTKKEALRQFIEMNKPFNDYWEMQLAWTCYTDGLSKDRQISEKQRTTWDNPCTPETFKKFNKKFQGGSNY